MFIVQDRAPTLLKHIVSLLLLNTEKYPPTHKHTQRYLQRVG